ncbi:alpha-N-arabinofuranosidase [soil metagenome]
MLRASVHLDPRWNRGPVDPRIYGGFLEHLGRAVYEGVYDPGSPRSDERGFRTDVIDALKKLKMPVMRYPGGNYVSAHDWRDGIGLKELRPRRLDFAWKSIEPNSFGTDEFIEWCRELGTEPMLAVNLGTAGAKESAEYVEYVNRPRGTVWADQRPSDEPYGVKLWCLGNEMDGPWQAGHVPAAEYARRADQAGKLMKGIDDSIETVVCGSSGGGMATYLSWDREVLEYCWDSVDYISLHRYSGNSQNDTAWFLAEGLEIDRVISDYRGLVEFVRGVKKSKKRIGLSFDEWNVWYRARGEGGDWQVAPPLLEEVYNLEDALVVAQYLMAFLRNADVLKIGCLAQIVNVIAPILTKSDGLLVQSIYHPIRMIAETGHGTALIPSIDSPLYAAGKRGQVPMVDVAAVENRETVWVYVTNRSSEESVGLDIDFERRSLVPVGGEIFGGSDPKAANSWETPDALVPRAWEGSEVVVPPLSFARFELRPEP